LTVLQPKQPIGLFGGTFDPVHNAHLRVALDVLEQLQLAEVRFIPSRQPPHRAMPGASARHRLMMLQHAIRNQPGFTIDERELRRGGPSYMADTLASLRTELPQTPLCLLLGLDAFRELTSWYHWQAIPELSHVLVMQRPGSDADDFTPALQHWVETSRIDDATGLQQTIAGRVLFWPVTQLAISASSIRDRIAGGFSARYLLPETVCEYICQHQLYQR
jgi:nicotinate-nucleotide adenylyltransferase